jgi:hypothetical protein
VKHLRYILRRGGVKGQSKVQYLRIFPFLANARGAIKGDNLAGQDKL